MATYFVWSGATGSATGADWTNAFTGLQAALTAATSGVDVIKVHKTHIENGGTFAAAANVEIICVDKDSSDALAVMNGTTGYIGSNVGTTLAGGYTVFVKGIALVTGTGASNYTITISSSDGSDFTFEDCKLWPLGNNASTRLAIGSDSAVNTHTTLNNCDIKFNNASAAILIRAAQVVVNGGSINSSGTAVSTLFTTTLRGCIFRANGFDMSHITGTLIGSQSSYTALFTFNSCKLGSGVAVLASQTPANLGSAHAELYNCSNGDLHYEFGHFNALGSTTAVTSPYVSDGALYDGTNHVTWKIVTTANCSIYTPYITPWIEKYNSNVSTAITPSLEGLVINNATVAQNDEIWGEFSYQGTSGSVLPVFVNDRMTLLGSPADQTSSKTYSDWTASPATDTGDSVFKLTPASSFTPQEIGMLRARACVGVEGTYYLDPKIRT